jgi:hypothetical protein
VWVSFRLSPKMKMAPKERTAVTGWTRMIIPTINVGRLYYLVASNPTINDFWPAAKAAIWRALCLWWKRTWSICETVAAQQQSICQNLFEE